MSRWLEMISLDDLLRRPALRNPKNHILPEIASSIDRHGFVENPAIDERTGRLVAGHGRLDALVARRASGEQPPDGVEVSDDGDWLVPVQRGWASASDSAAEAYVIASNALTINGGWEEDILAEMLKDYADDPDWLTGTGYDEKQVVSFLASLKGDDPEPLADPDDIPDEPRRVTTKVGDVWLLGDHRVICADAADAPALAVVMAGDKAEMLFADPPYGVSYASKNGFLNAIWPANRVEEPILGDHQTPDDMSTMWKAGFGAVRQFLSPGASYYVTGPQGGDLLLLLLLALREAGFPLRHMLIWAKNQFVIGRSDYHYQHEPILYGWVEGAAHRWNGDHGQASVWQIDKPRKSDLHPTMKPVALVTRALENSTQRGDIVLDPYCGSGTTVIAAHLAGRVARACEIDPLYTDVICRRFQDVTGIIPVLEATGKPHDFSL